MAAANAGIAAPGLIAAPYAAGIPYAAAGAYPYAYGAAPLAYAQAPVIAKAAPVAAAPVAVAPAPVAVAPAPVSSQYQAQDEFGNVNYGYSNINSAKQEVGNAYTGVAGSYKYVDANGVPQRVDYVADDLGFRITGATNLPVAPVEAPLAKALLPVAPVFDGVAPEPVVDTPEVAAAKAEFFAKFEEAASREKRSVVAAAPLATPFGGFTTAYSNINPGPVAGPLTPAYGDSVATPKGLRSLSLEGFSEDLNQDGFVDPMAPAVAAPAVTYVATPAVTYAAAPALAAYGAYPYAAAYAAPVAPKPVVDTPEVAAAKADFFAKFEEAKALHGKRKREASLGSYGHYGRGYGYRGYSYGRGYGYRG